MANPDVSAITSAFVEFGGQVFGKKVLEWSLRSQGVQVRTNVQRPQVLAKLSAAGSPRPYRSQDDTTSNGVAYTDRTLTVYNGKWDSDFDPEQFRNTYLAQGVFDTSFAQAATTQIAKEFLQSIMLNVLWLGVYNGAGSTPAAIANGWGTLLAADILSAAIPAGQVQNTGVITASNAVDVVEQVARNVSIYMRNNGFVVYCSYAVFDLYTIAYRTLNKFLVQPGVTGDYKLDNLNAVLRPVPWIPNTSQRLLATVEGNLVFGTDIEAIRVAASVRRNIIEIRPMMAAGCQYQDTDLIYVNDQA